MAARSPQMSPTDTYRAVLDAGYLEATSPSGNGNHNHNPNSYSSVTQSSNYRSAQTPTKKQNTRSALTSEPEVRFGNSEQVIGATDPVHHDRAPPPTSNEPHIAQPRAVSLRKPGVLRPRAGTTGDIDGSGGRFTEDWDASQRGSSILADFPSRRSSMRRSHSFVSNVPDEVLLNRGNTLRKKASLRRSGSLGRSGSRRSMKAGSVRSLALQSVADPDELHSALYCPIPASGNPTDALAGRFQAWRKVLKELIGYFKDVQAHYEQRHKSAVKLATASNGVHYHPGFLDSGGLNDAMEILRNFNKNAVLDANRAQEVEADVIVALAGLRSDLQQKIKEIKNLSGDFKNNVGKEMDNTKKVVKALQDVLGQAELDTSLTTGKQDPYLLRLAADRQVERQIDEENYLHQAYLNIEASGRELESIVVGEIQKAYNAYISILKREADAAHSAIEELRLGPIDMPKDHEWTQFMHMNDNFVDPAIPVRSAENVHYPGRDHVACQEVRAGLLERKSKYLKSYTAGWYVLSPTHLHEFKSADKSQAPVMSLYLPEQKLGSHSTEGTSSQKFILKGRQTGSMHRGHTWVFRAESHDTMMAWYEDIKALTGGTAKERSEFVMRGATGRSNSRASRRSTSSDGAVVDEEDEEPFSASSQVDLNTAAARQDQQARRPQPGGRFPSDVHADTQQGLRAPASPSTVSSGARDRGQVSALGFVGARGDQMDAPEDTRGYRPEGYGTTASQTRIDEAPSHAAIVDSQARRDGVNPYTNEPLDRDGAVSYGNLPMNTAMGGFEHQPEPQPQNSPSYTGPPILQDESGAQFGQGESVANQPSIPQGLEVAREDNMGASYGTSVPSGSVQDGFIGVGTLGSVPNEPTAETETLVSTAGDQRADGPTAAPPRGNLDRGPPTLANLHVPGMYPKSTTNLASNGAAR